MNSASSWYLPYKRICDNCHAESEARCSTTFTKINFVVWLVEQRGREAEDQHYNLFQTSRPKELWKTNLI
jgi:hypothetical protein